MSTLRKRWQLHTDGGAVPILDGSRFGFDRSWAPQGAGTLTLPMDHPGTASIVEHDRQALRLVCDLWHHAPPGTLGTGALVGASLGTAAWPDEPLALYPGSMVDEGGAPVTHKRAAWHVWPGRITRDHLARTVAVEVATVELRFVEALNAGGPWMPGATGPTGSYLLSDVLVQLALYLRIPLVVEPSTATIPRELLQPWGMGESAWSWFEGVRAAAFRSYRYDPTLNRVRFVGVTDAAAGTIPADWLEWGDELGGGAQDALRYADALLVAWTWTDADGTEHVEEELALAPGLYRWQDARRLLRLEQHSKRMPGVAAQIVKQLARWQRLATVVTALDEHSLVDLGTGRGLAVQAVDFGIDEEPTVTFTIITEE